MISNFNNGCNNCKHFDKTILEAPCNTCVDLSGNNPHSHWERDTTLKPEYRDLASFYPDFCTKSMNKPILHHSDNIDALRYCINDERPFVELMNGERVSVELRADLNKKENKNMKKQQRRRDRNILVVKELNTAIGFDEIIFNGPATIIKWKKTFDQIAWNKKADKTVTVCKEPDKLDKTTGFLLAVLKEILDNKSYGNILEKIDEINKENKQ